MYKSIYQTKTKQRTMHIVIKGSKETYKFSKKKKQQKTDVFYTTLFQGVNSQDSKTVVNNFNRHQRSAMNTKYPKGQHN